MAHVKRVPEEMTLKFWRVIGLWSADPKRVLVKALKWWRIVITLSVHNKSAKVWKFPHLFQNDHVSVTAVIRIVLLEFPKAACPTQALRLLWCFSVFRSFFPTGKLGVALGNVSWWQISTARWTNFSKNLPSAIYALYARIRTYQWLCLKRVENLLPLVKMGSDP